MILWEEEKLDIPLPTSSPSVINRRQIKKNPRQPTPNLTLRRDTADVIEALVKLDHEFEVIDGWLEKQIELFYDVQSKLSSIEQESGALETNWQNLSQVQLIIDTIIRELTISDEDVKLLKHPSWVMDEILRSQDLSNVDFKLEPLKSAIANLRHALEFKGHDIDQAQGELVSTSQWLELSSKMVAIQSQRQNLQEISDLFCEQTSSLLISLFPTLLKHKSLNDPNKLECIAIKALHFGSSLDSLFFTTPQCPMAGRASFDASDSVPHEKVLRRFDDLRSNPLMTSQRTFHEALVDFIPLIESIQALAPELSSHIADSYVTNVKEHLYNPMLKRLFKDSGTLLPQKPNALVTLASTPPLSKVGERPGAAIRLKAKASPPLSHWAALELILVLIAPIMKRESLFLEVCAAVI